MSAFVKSGIFLSVEEAQILYQGAQFRNLMSNRRDDTALYRILHAVALTAFSKPAADGSERRQLTASDEYGYTTVGQVARRAGISERTVRLHIAQQSLPATKNGREWVIATSEAETYIAAHRKN
ncbi:helix-turn-helix domain-containing protein [Microbacterium sp. NPDC089180]|uniref:helix-turn-helix domain-containing protein n=1 Tax=unclassified Microbacterium TaxID=2609290 RepID=UPI00341E9123